MSRKVKESNPDDGRLEHTGKKHPKLIEGDRGSPVPQHVNISHPRLCGGKGRVSYFWQGFPLLIASCGVTGVWACLIYWSFVHRNHRCNIYLPDDPQRLNHQNPYCSLDNSYLCPVPHPSPFMLEASHFCPTTSRNSIQEEPV